MTESYLAAVVEDCVRAMRSGATREDCLRAYPELRGRLDPLLRRAGDLQFEPALAFDGRRRVREGVMASVRTEPRERRRAVVPIPPPIELNWRPLSLGLALAPAAAVVVAVILAIHGLGLLEYRPSAAELGQ